MYKNLMLHCVPFSDTSRDKYRSAFVTHEMQRKIEQHLCHFVSLNGKHPLRAYISLCVKFTYIYTSIAISLKVKTSILYLRLWHQKRENTQQKCLQNIIIWNVYQ